MSRLFAEVYLDEDVDVLVADLLRARGFLVTTTVDAGHLGASDAEQLELASSRKLVFLTHNRDDFTALHTQYVTAGRHHSGIVVAVRRSPHEIAKRLLVILNRLSADELEDQLVFV